MTTGQAPSTTLANSAGLHRVLDHLADTSPEALALRFLLDGEEQEDLITYGQLARQARALAHRLAGHEVRQKTVIIAIPPSVDFIIALFACWYAGAIAVPAYPPSSRRQRSRLDAIIQDSGARHLLASPQMKEFQGMQVIAVERFTDAPSISILPEYQDDGPCLLQYTSGSTATPKGVMISHTNLRSHFSAAASHWRDLNLESAVSWLPPYHDMGLVLKILYSLEAGIPLTFFSPDHFVQRPIRWLRAISRFRGHLSGAPNFAYEMCLRRIRDEELAGLDLSCWKAASCGAERIRPETLSNFAARFSRHGFNEQAFIAGYGMAETTLSVTATPGSTGVRTTRHPSAGQVVSCGIPLPGAEITISDPSTGHACPEGQIGEIRVAGPTVCEGYWNNLEATLELSGGPSSPGIKTGDLGFILDGHLYVTGRIKELIIVDGVNHSPEDIEAVILREIPEISAIAAFPIDTPHGEGVGVAMETDSLHEDSLKDLCERGRALIGNELGLPIHRMVTLRSRLIPRTTSGKIQRSVCRNALAEGTLRITYEDRNRSSPQTTANSGAISTILDLVREVTGREGASAQDDVIGFGMSSMEVTRLSARLREATGANVPIGRIFSVGSFAELAGELTNADGRDIPSPLPYPGKGRDRKRLTHSQERMFFLHKIDPTSAAYHVFGSLELKGALNIASLKRAISGLLEDHVILRSRHLARDGAITIRLQEPDNWQLEIITTASDSEMERLLRSFAEEPFDLEVDAPFRTCLIKLEDHRHVLGVCAHHIIVDGWSMRLLANELAARYGTGKPGSAAPEIDYFDYAAWHRDWIDSGSVNGQIEYWRDRLHDHPGWMALPTDFPRSATTSSKGAAIERSIPAELCARVSDLARIHRATPFMIHLATFLLQLRRLGGTDDPLVALPVANRHLPGSGTLIGTLVNTLPFRLPLDPHESFSSLIKRVREATLEMQAAQDAPFEKIIEALGTRRSRDHSPLVQVMFDHQELPMPELWADGLQCSPMTIHRGASQFDLSLLLLSMNDQQRIAIEYRTDLFREETATAILNRYLECLETVCRQPDRVLSKLDFLTTAERHLLDKHSFGPSRTEFLQQTTPNLVSRSVMLHGTKSAVEGDGGGRTYSELASLSDTLSGTLHQRNIRKGDRVAVLLDRDVDLPVVLLAIWKTGAAYVPIDPANPAERTAGILEDQSPIPVIVSPSLLGRLPTGCPVLQLDELLEARPSEAPKATITPDDTAYIIYTSGSTGKPKGVVITHGALANFLLSMAETPGLGDQDRLLAITTISFDISILELFLPLITGGTVQIIPSRISRDGTALASYLHKTKATVMQATPATWRMMIDAGWQGSPGLKILCGGEVLDPILAHQLAMLGSEAWNLYGPTETTIWSTLWRIQGPADTVLVGSPIANTGAHVLAPDGSPLPPGIVGELWLSGGGLARGYWNRPELTTFRFQTIENLNGASIRAYRTGDLARWHEDGTLECLGRTDGQIKIRGFRVELGEIETTLASHPGVAQARASTRGEASNKRIVAWITARPGEHAEPDELRRFLARRLPAYMVPSSISQIDSFPLNPNGKIDLSGLDNPEQSAEKPGTTAASETELALAAIWEPLLRRTSIQPEDDWFQLGGHSLLVMKLFSKIHQELHVTLPLSTILEASTLRDLAVRVDQASHSGAAVHP